MSEFKVGDRVKTEDGYKYTVTAVGETFLLVKNQKLGEVLQYKSSCTIISDTIKVEMLREDVVYWAAYCTPSYESAFGTDPVFRLWSACNSTLAKENDE